MNQKRNIYQPKEDQMSPSEERKMRWMKEVAQPLTDRDRIIVSVATELVRAEYRRDWCHLASCGWGTHQAEPYTGLQLNCKRARESSICAEGSVLTLAHSKRDEIKVIVTVHGNHNGRDKPYVVPPCALCIARLQRWAPDCEVIQPLGDDLVKIPQSDLALFTYPIADTD